MSFDERIVPARKDIAADFLKNKHKSQKFVSGIKKEVIFPYVVRLIVHIQNHQLTSQIIDMFRKSLTYAINIDMDCVFSLSFPNPNTVFNIPLISYFVQCVSYFLPHIKLFSENNIL